MSFIFTKILNPFAWGSSESYEASAPKRRKVSETLISILSDKTDEAECRAAVENWLKDRTVSVVDLDWEASNKEETPISMLSARCHNQILKLILSKASPEKIDGLDGQGMGLIHYAARLGMQETLQKCLELGDVNLRTKEGRTPLMIAIEEEHKDLAHAILNCEYCDVDALDNNGVSALSFAWENGSWDIAERIITKIKKFDEPEKPTYSLLHCAAALGMTDKIDELIAAGVNINARTPDGATPLMMAIYEGHRDAAAKLLEVPLCDVDAVDHDGNTALTLAWEEKEWDLADLIIPKAHNFERDKRGYALIHYAACQGLVDKVRALVEEEFVDVNITSASGETPLIEAVQANRLDMVKYLISIPWCDLSIRNSNGDLPLLIANDDQDIDTEIVTMLINSMQGNPKINESNHLIHYAAEFGVMPKLQSLIDAGVDINMKGEEGKTPLMLALENKAYDAAQAFLSHPNCQVDIEDDEGKTALFYGAVNIELGKLILSKMKAYHQDKYGRTTMHFAASFGATELMAKFVEQGFTPNCIDQNQDTPLHYAVLGNQSEVVKFLLAQPGIKDEAENKFGLTPYQLAKAFKFKEIMKLLRPDLDLESLSSSSESEEDGVLSIRSSHSSESDESSSSQSDSVHSSAFEGFDEGFKSQEQDMDLSE